MNPDDIDAEIKKARSTLVPSPYYRTFEPDRVYLPSQTLRVHTPPRMSRKTIHHIRHAAAKLFMDLGLNDVARVQGWIIPQPEWDVKYQVKEDEVPWLPDVDLEVAGQMMDEEKQLIPNDPAPLKGYYDDVELHSADLNAFDVPLRLDSTLNPSLDATIAISNIQPFLLLEPNPSSHPENGSIEVMGGLASDLTSPLGLSAQQAAQVGISHSTLLRNLVNQTMRRHFMDKEASSSSSSLPEAEVHAEEELVELSAGPVLNVYSSAVMLRTTPDSWDLLLALRDQHEDVECAEIAHMFEMQEEGEELLDLAGTMHELLEEYSDIIPAEGASPASSTSSDPSSLLSSSEEDPLLTFSTQEDAMQAAVEAGRPLPRVIEGGIGQDIAYDPFLGVKDWITHEEIEPQILPLMTEEEAEGSHLIYETGEGSTPVSPRSPYEGSALDLKAKHPELSDDEIMRLVVGVSPFGAPLDPEGFVEVCKMGPGASETLAYELEAWKELGLQYDPNRNPEEQEEEEEGEMMEGDEEGDQRRQGGGGDADDILRALGWGSYSSPEEQEASENQRLDIVAQTPMTRDLRKDTPGPQKVWILMGGDPVRSTDSLRSGLEVVKRLSHYSDLEVEPFFLAPFCAGSNERTRRLQLLKMRNDWLSYGYSEEELPSHLSLRELRSMPSLHVKMEHERVWALTQSTAIQNSAHAVLDACERAHKESATSLFALSRLEQQGMEARWDVQMELEANGFKGVGQLWGGAYDAPSPVPPRSMSMLEFAKDAIEEGALIFIATQGTIGGGEGHPSGTLESFLATLGVMFTGGGAEAIQACASRAALEESLRQMEGKGVSAPPFLRVPVSYLEFMASSYEAGKEGEDLSEAIRGFYEALRAFYGEAAASGYDQGTLDKEGLGQGGCLSMSIRPDDEGGGGNAPACLGYARISSPRDLMIYAQAVSTADPLIPANELSASAPHPVIYLPKFLPEAFILEPYIQTEPVFLLDHDDMNVPGDEGEERELCDEVVEMATFTALETWVDANPKPRVHWAGNTEPSTLALDEHAEQGGGAATAATDSSSEDESVSEQIKARPPSRWLQVCFGALGSTGGVEILGPSIAAHLPPSSSSLATSPSPTSSSPSSSSHEGKVVVHEEAVGGVHTLVHMCNLHEPLGVKEEVISMARHKVLEVVEGMGLCGLVQVDALMDADQGDLVVLSVNPHPNLCSDSPLYALALHQAQDPLYPHELLRAVVIATLAEYSKGGEEDEEEGHEEDGGDGLEEEIEGEDEEEGEEAGFDEIEADVEAEVDQGEDEEENVVGGTGFEEAEETDYQSNWT